MLRGRNLHKETTFFRLHLLNNVKSFWIPSFGYLPKVLMCQHQFFQVFGSQALITLLPSPWQSCHWLFPAPSWISFLSPIHPCAVFPMRNGESRMISSLEIKNEEIAVHILPEGGTNEGLRCKDWATPVIQRKWAPRSRTYFLRRSSLTLLLRPPEVFYVIICSFSLHFLPLMTSRLFYFLCCPN